MRFCGSGRSTEANRTAYPVTGAPSIWELGLRVDARGPFVVSGEKPTGGHEVAPVTNNPGGPITTDLRVNERIRVPEVRLVGPNGEQVGIVRIEDALRLAQEADLDLVEVAATARPPVCKLMDFGKYKYETAQKARESRRNQTNTVIKEMKLRPKIDPHLNSLLLEVCGNNSGCRNT